MAPIVLAVVGVVLLAIVFSQLLPDQDEVSSPSQPFLSIDSTLPVSFINYAVFPSKSGVTVSINVTSRQAANGASPADLGVVFALYLPLGWSFLSCRQAGCYGQPRIKTHNVGLPDTVATWELAFSSSTGSTDGGISIEGGHHFGFASDSITEAVALPEVQVNEPNPPSGSGIDLDVQYDTLANPGGYDWSSLPPQAETKSYVLWVEELVDGYEPSRVVTGVNHSAEASQNRTTFLAGALAGVAGAALIAALQEGLRLRLRRTRTARSE